MPSASICPLSARLDRGRRRRRRRACRAGCTLHAAGCTAAAVHAARVDGNGAGWPGPTEPPEPESEQETGIDAALGWSLVLSTTPLPPSLPSPSPSPPQ